ncbi:MAG TPA: hypothetical protein VMG13_14720, partial [Trebonia sp.]|nr:hypothetical protein [Trebonia sp.]
KGVRSAGEDRKGDCGVYARRLIGVDDLRSVIVDNAWNQNRQEPEESLARGKSSLMELVEWFLN